MEQIIEKTATGLGNGIGSLAESGVLWAVFALVWVGFGAALVWSQGSVDAVWETVRGFPLVVEGLVWVLFLPVMAGIWVWETAWPALLRLGVLAALAAWTLLVFPKPWD